MSRSRFTGLFALPVLVAAASAFPQDVTSDFAAAIDLWERGRKQESLDAMRRLLASDPDPAEVFEVITDVDSDVLVDFMAEGDEYSRVASRFLERASLGRAEIENDQERINELAREYFAAESTAERLQILARLEAQHGEYAAPRFVNALADDSDPDRVRDAMIALQSLGADAVLPLVAALESDNAYQRQSAAMALGNIGDPRAGAALRALATTDENESVRSAAAMAAERCGASGDSGASGDPVALYLKLGDDYHHRRATVLRDMDYSDVVWSWGDGSLTSREVPRAIYNNELAKGAYYEALELSPESMDALAGIARESVDIHGKLAALDSAGEDVSEVMEAADRGMLAVLSAGPAAIDRALQMSVQTGDSATGSRLARQLGRVATQPTDGLGAALAAGGASMSGEAAVALANIAVSTRTAASADVVQQLGTAAGRRVVKVVLVIDGDAQRANDIVAALEERGVLARHAGTGAQGVVALGQLAGIDAVLVGDDLSDVTTDAVVARIRQTPALAATPTFLLTADEELADAYGDRIQGSFAGADGIDALQEVFEARMDQSRERADDLAARAAEALAALALAGRSEMAPAAEGLLAAIDGRRDGIAVPALEAIGEIGKPEHVNPVLAVLANGSNSDAVRIAAADTIGAIGGRHDLAEAVANALREVLGDEGASLELRSAVARALGRMDLGAPSRAGVLQSIRVDVGAG